MPQSITSTASGDLGMSNGPFDTELGLHSHGKATPMGCYFRLPKMIADQGLEFTVFLLTFFTFFWSLVRIFLLLVAIVVVKMPHERVDNQ
jgi:hypothetical protein